jgi:5'(3')-deoxyribonucleotidase
MQKNISSKKTIALDFDGVIAEYKKGWFDKGIFGQPIDGAKEAIKNLLEQYHVVIFTCRHHALVKKWLLLQHFPNLEVTNIKPGAVQYIDDRSYKFTNWKDYFDNN